MDAVAPHTAPRLRALVNQFTPGPFLFAGVGRSGGEQAILGLRFRWFRQGRVDVRSRRECDINGRGTQWLKLPHTGPLMRDNALFCASRRGREPDPPREA